MGSNSEEGWGWVAPGDGPEDDVIEAYRLSDFVKNTLRNVVIPSALPSCMKSMAELPLKFSLRHVWQARVLTRWFLKGEA